MQFKNILIYDHHRNYLFLSLHFFRFFLPNLFNVEPYTNTEELHYFNHMISGFGILKKVTAR